jgi:hypothetical protein
MKKDSLLPHFLRTAGQLTGMAAWQTGRLFRKAATSALDAILEVLRAELKKGNKQLVVDFLTNKALPAARHLLLERMAARLLVHIGLRGVLASSVVGWVLPFVLEQMVKVGQKTGVFEKIRANGTVQDSLLRLDELKRAVWKRLVPDYGSSAEVLDDEAEQPRQLPA